MKKNVRIGNMLNINYLDYIFQSSNFQNLLKQVNNLGIPIFGILREI